MPLPDYLVELSAPSATDSFLFFLRNGDVQSPAVVTECHDYAEEGIITLGFLESFATWASLRESKSPDPIFLTPPSKPANPLGLKILL